MGFSVGKVFKKAKNAVKKVAKGVGKGVKKVVKSKVGRIAGQAAASYFGGPAGGAAFGAAMGYNDGGLQGAVLGGGLGYLGGKGMQNAGFTYDQNGYTNLMNGTLGAGAGGTAARGFRGDGVINPLNGGGSFFDNNWGNIASNALGGQSNDFFGKLSNINSLMPGESGGVPGGAGGQTDWGSLLGQLGGGALAGIGTTNGADAYGDVIRQGINYGKDQAGIQAGYANEVPGQIAAYSPATQGQVAYEQGTPNNPYTAQAGAYGQQLSDILSGKTDWKTDPGYAFRMQQGQQETERNAASRGYNQSGNIMAALQDRAQGTASQEYQNITSRLAGLQDQYANQDINAQGVSSGDRRNNASNRTGFINNMFTNQAGYRGNAGNVTNGILGMYGEKAGAAGLEAQAPWQYGASALGGAVSDPTVGRTTGGWSGLKSIFGFQ